MLDRSPRGGDFVRAHRGVADEDDAVVAAVGVDEAGGRRALVEAAAIVAPDALVQTIVEVEVFEPLELQSRRRKQRLRGLDVPIHRAADVQEQQHLDGVATLGPELDVDVALVGGGANRAVEVELVLGALARKTPEPPQRDPDVARPQRLVASEILEFAFVPDLRRTAAAALVLADPPALGVVAIRAERRGSAGADPFRAALVATLLFGETLAQ